MSVLRKRSLLKFVIIAKRNNAIMSNYDVSSAFDMILRGDKFK
jgi:hypothetical protein